MIASSSPQHRVGHVFITNTIGGCESCCRTVMKHAEEAEHHVLFFAPTGEATAMLEPFATSVTHHPISSKSFREFRNVVKTWAEERQLDGAILWHGMVALPPLIQGLERAGAKILVHGGNPSLQASLKQDLKFLFLEKLFPSKRLPTYFTCSAYVARSYQISRYLCRFPREVIHNGAALLSAPERAPKGKDVPLIVGMTARMDEGKDHALVLNAFALALKTVPNLKLEFLGDGPLRPQLEALTKSLGLEPSVHFHGTRVDILEVMKFWDILAYATTDAEGFGNALVEGMSLGLPCAVPQVGPISEVVGQPPRALLVPRKDPQALAKALQDLAENEELRQHFGNAAKAYALEHYAPQTYAKRVISLLLRSQ